MKRSILIGTGNIAHVHAEALKQIDSVRIDAVMDVDADAADAFAKKYGISRSYHTISDVLDAQPDVVHVLTPPPTHFAIASEFLCRGISVFLEKPMAETADQCRELQSLAQKHSAALRVNQNYAFAPAHQKLQRALSENRIGPVRSVTCTFAMPLRQLAARQFGHWMFNAPLNLLLEQGVHPVSLIDDLTGPVTVETVWNAAPREYAPGTNLITEWMTVLRGNDIPAFLQIKLGAEYPDWRLTVLGSDGRIETDYLLGTTTVSEAGAYLEFAEHLRTSLHEGVSASGQGIGAAAKYLAAQAGLGGRSDSFFLSIRNSIRAFYNDLETGGPNLDGSQGARIVAVCEDIAGKSDHVAPEPTQQARPATPAKTPSILLLGGTGFIGTHLVARLNEAGECVRVLARNISNLSTNFQGDNVELIKGSLDDQDALRAAMTGVSTVVNLAHGGGGSNWEEIRAAMVGGAERVAHAAGDAGVAKLLHVGSIAALYLGDPDTIVTHNTSVDPLRDERADYSRAKAEADLALLAMHTETGLPVSIFRPGVVLGEGTSPFHTGIGWYNRDRVCLGWNAGQNPLPLVLVEDVAAAMFNAMMNMEPDKLAGNCFNLVGDIRLTAREYTAELATATGRPLVYRPQSLWRQQTGEVAKWLIKNIGGRKTAFPSMRDLKSRGLVSFFDTSFEKEVLSWQPVDDRQVFLEKAIRIHGVT